MDEQDLFLIFDIYLTSYIPLFRVFVGLNPPSDGDQYGVAG